MSKAATQERLDFETMGSGAEHRVGGRLKMALYWTATTILTGEKLPTSTLARHGGPVIRENWPGSSSLS